MPGLPCGNCFFLAALWGPVVQACPGPRVAVGGLGEGPCVQAADPKGKRQCWLL